MTWTIRPNAGVGPLTFGMLREEVARLGLGPVLSLDLADDGSLREVRRPEDPILHYRCDKLCAIEAGPGVKDLNMGGIRIYETPARELAKALEGTDGAAYQKEGGLRFPRIGIAAWGFYDAATGSYADAGAPGRTLVFTPRGSCAGLAEIDLP